jgi:putative OPT family oligopeptide transporter
MLAIGVVAVAFIIPPILNLLFQAYGMAGVFPHPGMSHSQMLGAPQASLMAAITKGLLTGNLPWAMIILGAVLAVFICIADSFLKRYDYHLPALAVGLAIYLPPIIMTPIITGTLINWAVKKRNQKLIQRNQMADTQHKENYQNGLLLACGMVAGSALVGVILAIPFVVLGSSDALALVNESFKPIASLIGVMGFALLAYWFYWLSTRKG